MAMAWAWTIMVAVSVVLGASTGRAGDVGKAALDGAQAAVTLCIGLCGATCLWTGVMEVMRRSGMADGLKRLMNPLVHKLFPGSRRNPGAMEAVSANITANLLGLGNAATPLGIKAALEMSGRIEDGAASDDLCTLVVLNTASIQLIPSSVAVLRAASGAASPFDILPAVWISSLVSAAAGIAAAKLLSRIWRK